ncbi:MAG: hypothetical protein ACI9C1_003284 [Candidatus Aldehydirespiratoraceae bacterium]
MPAAYQGLVGATADANELLAATSVVIERFRAEGVTVTVHASPLAEMLDLSYLEETIDGLGSFAMAGFSEASLGSDDPSAAAAGDLVIFSAADAAWTFS